jgi:heptosyltransferase III
MRAGALGDTLMLMPSIHALKKDNEIFFAGRLPAIDYIKPYVNSCIDMESSGWHSLFMKDTDRPLKISLQPDHVVAFLNDPGGDVARNLRVSFPGSVVNVFPVFPLEGDERHIALYMAQALQEAGLPINAIAVFEDTFQTPLMAAEDSFSNDTGPVVIHPGSGSMRKNYPPLFWFQLIRELQKTMLSDSKRITLLFGPAEEGIVTQFRDEFSEKGIELKILPEREELIYILGRASVYIGHDSGITHLAAMLGKPVIAVFKDSSVGRWRPLGPNVRIIKNGTTLHGTLSK